MTGEQLATALAEFRAQHPERAGTPSSYYDREPDGEPTLELDDDVREHEMNYTREYGAMLTRGGW